MAKTIHTTDAYTWIHLESPTPVELKAIAKQFSLSYLDVEDILEATQRSKIELYEEYAFLVVKFPIYSSGAITSSAETDFFITPTHLITISKDRGPALETFMHQLLKDDSALLHTYPSPMHLGIAMIKEIVSSLQPYVKHLAASIDELEEQMFYSRSSREMVKEGAHLNVSIITVQKMLSPIRVLLEDLEHDSPARVRPYVSDVRDVVEHMWASIHSEDQVLDELQRMHETLVSHKTNEIMRTLTVVSVMIMPISLIAGIFGTNFTYMPFIHETYGFWIMIFMMFVVASTLALAFRRSRWL